MIIQHYKLKYRPTYSKKFFLILRLRLQKSQKSFSASSRYGYYWEDAGENLRTLRQHSGANFSRVH